VIVTLRIQAPVSDLSQPLSSQFSCSFLCFSTPPLAKDCDVSAQCRHYRVAYLATRHATRQVFYRLRPGMGYWRRIPYPATGSHPKWRPLHSLVYHTTCQPIHSRNPVNDVSLPFNRHPDQRQINDRKSFNYLSAYPDSKPSPFHRPF